MKLAGATKSRKVRLFIDTDEATHLREVLGLTVTDGQKLVGSPDQVISGVIAKLDEVLKGVKPARRTRRTKAQIEADNAAAAAEPTAEAEVPKRRRGVKVGNGTSETPVAETVAEEPAAEPFPEPVTA